MQENLLLECLGLPRLVSTHFTEIFQLFFNFSNFWLDDYLFNQMQYLTEHTSYDRVEIQEWYSIFMDDNPEGNLSKVRQEVIGNFCGPLNFYRVNGTTSNHRSGPIMRGCLGMAETNQRACLRVDTNPW